MQARLGKRKNNYYFLTNVTYLEAAVQLFNVVLRAPACCIDVIGRGVSQSEVEFIAVISRIYNTMYVAL